MIDTTIIITCWSKKQLNHPLFQHHSAAAALVSYAVQSQAHGEVFCRYTYYYFLTFFAIFCKSFHIIIIIQLADYYSNHSLCFWLSVQGTGKRDGAGFLNQTMQLAFLHVAYPDTRAFSIHICDYYDYFLFVFMIIQQFLY